MIRTLLIVALGTTMLLGAACGDDDDDEGAETPDATATTGGAEASPTGGAIPGDLTTINVVDNSYTPTGLQVPVGTTVTWNWEGSFPHSVTGTFNGETVDSGVLEAGGEFEFEFASAGVFEYECSVHGAAMSGTVTVQ